MAAVKQNMLERLTINHQQSHLQAEIIADRVEEQAAKAVQTLQRGLILVGQQDEKNDLDMISSLLGSGNATEKDLDKLCKRYAKMGDELRSQGMKAIAADSFVMMERVQDALKSKLQATAKKVVHEADLDSTQAIEAGVALTKQLASEDLDKDAAEVQRIVKVTTAALAGAASGEEVDEVIDDVKDAAGKLRSKGKVKNADDLLQIGDFIASARRNRLHSLHMHRQEQYIEWAKHAIASQKTAGEIALRLVMLLLNEDFTDGATMVEGLLDELETGNMSSEQIIEAISDVVELMSSLEASGNTELEEKAADFMSALDMAKIKKLGTEASKHFHTADDCLNHAIVNGNILAKQLTDRQEKTHGAEVERIAGVLEDVLLEKVPYERLDRVVKATTNEITQLGQDKNISDAEMMSAEMLEKTKTAREENQAGKGLVRQKDILVAERKALEKEKQAEKAAKDVKQQLLDNGFEEEAALIQGWERMLQNPEISGTELNNAAREADDLATMLREQDAWLLAGKVDYLAEKLRGAGRALLKKDAKLQAEIVEKGLEGAVSEGFLLSGSLRDQSLLEDAKEVERLTKLCVSVSQGHLTDTELLQAIEDLKREAKKLKKQLHDEDVEILEKMQKLMEEAYDAITAVQLMNAEVAIADKVSSYKRRPDVHENAGTDDDYDDDDDSFDDESDDEDDGDIDEVRELAGKLRDAGKVEGSQTLSDMLEEVEKVRHEKYITSLEFTQKEMEKERSNAVEGMNRLITMLRKGKHKSEADALAAIAAAAEVAITGDDFLQLTRDAEKLAEKLRNKDLVEESNQVFVIATDMMDAAILQYDMQAAKQRNTSRIHLYECAKQMYKLSDALIGIELPAESKAVSAIVVLISNAMSETENTMTTLEQAISDINLQDARLRAQTLDAEADKLNGLSSDLKVALEESLCADRTLSRVSLYRTEVDANEKLVKAFMALGHAAINVKNEGMQEEAGQLDAIIEVFDHRMITNDQFETSATTVYGIATAVLSAQNEALSDDVRAAVSALEVAWQAALEVQTYTKMYEAKNWLMNGGKLAHALAKNMIEKQESIESAGLTPAGCGRNRRKAVRVRWPGAVVEDIACDIDAVMYGKKPYTRLDALMDDIDVEIAKLRAEAKDSIADQLNECLEIIRAARRAVVEVEIIRIMSELLADTALLSDQQLEAVEIASEVSAFLVEDDDVTDESVEKLTTKLQSATLKEVRESSRDVHILHMKVQAMGEDKEDICEGSCDLARKLDCIINTMLSIQIKKDRIKIANTIKQAFLDLKSLSVNLVADKLEGYARVIDKIRGICRNIGGGIRPVNELDDVIVKVKLEIAKLHALEKAKLAKDLENILEELSIALASDIHLQRTITDGKLAAAKVAFYVAREEEEASVQNLIDLHIEVIYPFTVVHSRSQSFTNCT